MSCVAPPLLTAATTVDAEAFQYTLDGVRSDLTTVLSTPRVQLTTEAATCAAHTLSHLYAVLASRCDEALSLSAPELTAELNAAVGLLAEATAAGLWPGEAATQWTTPQFALAAGVVPAGGRLEMTLPGLHAILHAPSGGLRDNRRTAHHRGRRSVFLLFPVRKGVALVGEEWCFNEGRTSPLLYVRNQECGVLPPHNLC